MQVRSIVFVMFIFGCGNNKPSKLPKTPLEEESFQSDDKSENTASQKTSVHRSSQSDDNKCGKSEKVAAKKGCKNNVIDGKNKGAYLYYDDAYKTNILFIYMKLPKEKLKNDTQKPYLVAHFVNGTDYLGQASYNDIATFINDAHAINILTKDYKEIHKALPTLKLSEFNEHLAFAKGQLKNI